MKLKLDDAGHAVLQEGKPVYVHEDGKESPFDAASTVATLNRLYGEAKGHREAKEAAEKKLKSFDGIDDPVKALEALRITANLDAKKLIDAGEMEQVKAGLVSLYTKQIEEITARTKQMEDALFAEKIGGAFARSQFAKVKLSIPADIVQARFEHHFKVEDGKTVAYDVAGNKIFSRQNPGEVAGFEEALELLVAAYPYRDQIMLGSQANGGGARGGAGGSPQADRSKMSPAEKAKYIREHGQEAYLKLPATKTEA